MTHTVIVWLEIAAIFFMLFIAGMIIGIKRKKVNMVILATALLIMGLTSGGVAVYFFVKQGLN
jgi:hypothetical protein